MTWLKRWWARRVLSMNGVCTKHFLCNEVTEYGIMCDLCYTEFLEKRIAKSIQRRERVKWAKSALKGTK